MRALEILVNFLLRMLGKVEEVCEDDGHSDELTNLSNGAPVHSKPISLFRKAL